MQVRSVQQVRDYHLEALALVEKWFPSLWVRNHRGQTWSPARPSVNPPLITDSVMVGLIDNGLVEVHGYSNRGVANVVRPHGATTSSGAAMRYRIGRLTTEHTQF